MSNRLIAPRNRLILPRGYQKPANPVLDNYHPINRGLTGCWLLGDVVGGIEYDISTTSNNMAFTGSPTLGPSHHGGQSLKLSGSSQSIQAVSNPAYDAIPGTWSCWINTSSLNGGYPAIMSRTVSTSLGEVTVFLDGSTSKLRVQVYTPGTGTTKLDITGGAALTDGKWHHVVFSFQSNTGVSALYVDGVSVATGTASGAWVFSSSALQVGTSTDSFWKNFLGSVDGVRVYNRLLSAAEVQQLYAEPYTGIYNFNYSIVGVTSTGSGVFVDSGTSSATFTGQSTFSGAFVDAGSSSTSFVGNSNFSSILTSAGSSTASFIGQSTAQAILSAAGISTASFNGQSNFSSVLAASGDSSASFVSPSTVLAALTASGTSAASFISGQTIAAAFAAAGNSTFLGSSGQPAFAALTAAASSALSFLSSNVFIITPNGYSATFICSGAPRGILPYVPFLPQIVHIAEEGFTLIIDAGQTLTGYDYLELQLAYPDGSVASVLDSRFYVGEATFDAPQGFLFPGEYIVFTTSDTDLPIKGITNVTIQGYVGTILAYTSGVAQVRVQ